MNCCTLQFKVLWLYVIVAIVIFNKFFIFLYILLAYPYPLSCIFELHWWYYLWTWVNSEVRVGASDKQQEFLKFKYSNFRLWVNNEVEVGTFDKQQEFLKFKYSNFTLLTCIYIRRDYIYIYIYIYIYKK